MQTTYLFSEIEAEICYVKTSVRNRQTDSKSDKSLTCPYKVLHGYFSDIFNFSDIQIQPELNLPKFSSDNF